MQEERIEIENAKFQLGNIYSTLSLILEEMDEEHGKSEEFPQIFFDRMSTVYIPALELIRCSTSDLLGRM
ncbi:MAG: hypothetical protein ACLT1A_11375 [Dysosmobacter sp.]